MTNRKTIERLKAVRNYLCAGNPIWDVNEMRDVFELAISALQAQELSKNSTKLDKENGELVTDCISRQAAIDVLMEIMDRPNHADFLYTDEICKTLNDLPSAQLEIIRCKDCIWYELPSHKITENCVRWMKSNGILLPIKPDDFCSRAERRTDERSD